MATIKDVAKLAGVSTTTVSHVINKTRFVAEDTTKAVWDAVAQLNYSPSAVARSLKMNSTKSIGMIVTTSEEPYFAEVILAVETRCYEQGYSLFLCNTQNDPDKIQDYVDMLLKKRVDGILIMCSEYTESSKVLFNGINTPMVVMDWGPDDGKSDRIIDHSFEGGYIATKYLIDKGHREIGFITGNLDKTTARQRYEGAQKAMKEAGLPINENWVLNGDFEVEGGFECMKHILSQKTTPTAVFCSSDRMALGALSAISLKGLSVPEDISVIGYNNTHTSAYYPPPLTTVHQSKKRFGREALMLLLDRIAHKEEAQTRKTLEYYPELIERASVRDLNQAKGA